MSKYNRSQFYTVESVDSKKESDFMTNKWREFVPTRPGTYYTISDKDLKRPDLLSYYVYNRTDYWWILARVNNIDDFFNDLIVGDVIFVPNKLDIEEHYVKSANN